MITYIPYKRLLMCASRVSFGWGGKEKKKSVPARKIVRAGHHGNDDHEKKDGATVYIHSTGWE